MVYEDIQRMDVDEISKLKIQIYESRSEATELRARVAMDLIAKDRVHCLPWRRQKRKAKL